ncbi:MAG: hypothetical protein R6V05_05885 [Candidatus Brocadiia bacterium]
MASIVLVCPSCGRKLETSDRNIGRDGQCPSCETIFEISGPYRGGGGGAVATAEGSWLESAPAEYRETSAVSAALAVFIGLVVLSGITSLPWTRNPLGQAGSFIAQEKLHILTVSVACCAFLVTAALTHKSLLPGVLLSGAWATVVLIWVGGLLYGLETYAKRLTAVSAFQNVVTNFTPASGLYVALIVSFLLVAVCLYAYSRFKGVANLRHFVLVAVLVQLLAVLAGAAVLYLHGYAEVSRIGEAAL